VPGGLRDYESRQYFLDKFNVRAFDAGFQAVLESVEGNRKDSLLLVRGVCDYDDGTSADKATSRRRSDTGHTSERDWRPYAALAAAGVMKCIVLDVVATADDDDDD